MPDAQRRLVVRPRVRGAGGTVVLHELFEERRDPLQELGVARDDVARAQAAERTVRDLGVDRPERAAERDQLRIAEAAVGAHEPGRQLPRLREQAPADGVGVGAVGLRPLEDDRPEALDELPDRPRQDVVVAALRHHPGIIVARAPQT